MQSEEAAMTQDPKTGVGRRQFLRGLGVGAGLAATAAAPLATSAVAAESNDERAKARYKETDHVKTFYRVNRYPAK
jgi:hypothetical protein